MPDDDPIHRRVFLSHASEALGLAPQDATPRPDPVPASPMAELILKLKKPRIHEEGASRRAAAAAEVLYKPADGGRGIDGEEAVFVAPLGPIEAGDLRWYLEAYGIWPFGTFKDRAKKIEEDLPVWGRKLFDVVLGRTEGRAAFDAWRNAAGVERRVTVFVDDRGPEETRPARAEAATRRRANLGRVRPAVQGFARSFLPPYAALGGQSPLRRSSARREGQPPSWPGSSSMVRLSDGWRLPACAYGSVAHGTISP
jgi:hypothetical protein